MKHDAILIAPRSPRNAILTTVGNGAISPLGTKPAVNKVIAEYEAKTGAQPFDMATGERLEKVTREQNEVLMVHPIAGG